MKVLIVEDEILERKALIHLMKTEFEQVSIVLTADNGEQAVKMAVQERPDLILMDINLPLLDGISAMKKIREQLEDCPVIMVSAYSDYEHLRGSMREHALDYLVKPYSVETFVEAVKRGLGIDNKREEPSFYGKTGSGNGEAWFVGFSESDGERKYIAIYLNDSEHRDQVSGNKAKEIVLDILKDGF